ncbi:regulator of sigma E protease [Abditibacterium utsteinense]|uniref:Regulator of sigma E protease n=1 Tax=Abditibacterium utsteinense TaxID=1960156 RepID=A0A2S8SWJ2_9BACT|nr:M50 family metallopeptidase [Abditibacterium utsteinense]PQV65176.1 regulator of sigma E protease [Abditibacterium utsteinense]
MSQSVQVSPNNSTPPTEKPQSRLFSLAQIALGIAGVVVLALRFPDLARTIVVFAIILGVLIFVHEWGHFQFARWAGMKVNRFAIGFPPFIFNREKNGITYSIGALPIGGMVDIAGLGSEEEMVNTAKGEVAEPKRDISRPFGQRQFQDASLFGRFMTLFAGPLMNFLFAIILAIGLFSFVGRADYEKAQDNKVGLLMGESPAAKAGVEEGDLLIGINGKAANNSEALRKLIHENGKKNLKLEVLRDGKKLEKTMIPEFKEQPTADGKGSEMVPTIGVVFTYNPTTLVYEKVGIGEAVKLSFTAAYRMSAQILETVKRAFTFKLTEVERNGIGGPVKIAQTVGQVAKDGQILPLLELTAALSINLGLMNLLPLPALDGGRILFLGFEFITRRPFNPKWEGLVHAAGMVMLLVFMLLITGRDLMPFLKTIRF